MEQKFNLYEKLQFLLEDKAEDLLNVLLHTNSINHQKIGNYCADYQLNDVGDYLLDMDSESVWIEFLLDEDLMLSALTSLHCDYNEIYLLVKEKLDIDYPISILNTNETISISIDLF